MVEQTDVRSEPRAPWTRPMLLRAAIDLADESGIESLSMRRLSQSLGGGTMSLYNHVANKDDLLDGMIDVVFSEIELPDPEAPWQGVMRRRAVSMRTVMTRHPWAIGLPPCDTTTPSSVASLAPGPPSPWQHTPSQPATRTSMGSHSKKESRVWQSRGDLRTRNGLPPTVPHDGVPAPLPA